MTLLRWIFWAFLRLALGARYRLHIRGKEQLRGLKGPVLVLPNHPGYIDPFVLFSALSPSLRMRPLVYSGTFQGWFGRFLVKLIDALEIPDLGVASTGARNQAEESIQEIVQGLKSGASFSLWPAGHVWHEGLERIGPARAAADILRQAPETSVLLVRSHGIWGSSWTWAQLAARPSLIRCIVAGIGWIFANLFFFMPRRHVQITLEVVDRARLPELRRETLNPWLEEWYNQDLGGQPEKPTWVPYHFLFGRRSFEFPPSPREAHAEVAEVKPETRQAVLEMLAEGLGRPLSAEEQRPEVSLEYLGLDSLDRMELSLEVERRFGFTGDEACLTIGQLFALAEGRARKKSLPPPPPEWFRPPEAAGPLAFEGDTIPEAFVAHALRNPKEIVVADDLAGALSGERLLIGALMMARRLKEVPEPNVGLLLPASAACDMALLALHLAGKLPVVLNWTTGPANLAHAARVMKLSHVVTSKAFADRIGVAVEGTNFLFLEDIKASIGKAGLLWTLLKVRFFHGSILRSVPRMGPDSPAVVLFTSGSEKAPKAVPLTHANLLSCIRLGVPFMGLTRQDVMLGFLPAFHSFGMTVTGLLPLLTGLRVVHHPDPTDAANLARKIGAYKVTVLIGTPTFVHHILERARPGELNSLRLIVTGAEKCPDALFERCRQAVPGAVVLEGYGITECSPVVAANPPAAPRQGSIGKPLPGVEVRVVDLESGAPLPAGKMGMLQVSGPTVFPGYLGHEGAQPFIEEQGKRWYVTGDLGEYDQDGYLHFRGRLKRFLKAGGEMISLPALEEPFARRFPPSEDGPRVAVEGLEHEGGRRVVLFTTEPISLRDANALLMQEGFHGVMRLDEVRLIDKVPVLGTGKTDYKQLRALLAAG
jgi:long-chain-fatty-acid--[acyl-carrier-protein] ligase